MRFNELGSIFQACKCNCAIHTEDWSPLFAVYVRDYDILGRVVYHNLLLGLLLSFILSLALLLRHPKGSSGDGGAGTTFRVDIEKFSRISAIVGFCPQDISKLPPTLRLLSKSNRTNVLRDGL